MINTFGAECRYLPTCGLPPPPGVGIYRQHAMQLNTDSVELRPLRRTDVYVSGSLTVRYCSVAPVVPASGVVYIIYCVLLLTCILV